MYIVCIDIAKRFHEAAIIDKAGKIVVKRIRFANSHSGFLKLMDAVKKLDALADFVTLDNDHDGVAAAIEKFF